MQQHIFKKATNYVGNNVLIRDGNVRMVQAKEKIAAAKELKEQMKANRMALIDDYVSSILSDSLENGSLIAASRRPTT